MVWGWEENELVLSRGLMKVGEKDLKGGEGVNIFLYC